MDRNIRILEGQFMQPKGRIAIVASRFNEFIVERLITGCIDTLKRQGVQTDNIELIRVPGGFEIPLACQTAAESGRFEGVIALGVIIRGATPHFDYVAASCTNGLMNAQLKTKVPMAFGVLTTDSIEQAVERAGTKAGNKGIDCALTLIEMLDVLEKVRGR
jgi:6,7-dimethyl-8-ribityllumazine synthase